MNLSEVVLDKSDFETCDWQGIVAACEDKTCNAFSRLFGERAKEARTAGNPSAERALSLLGAVTSLMLKPDSKEEPFVPMASFESWRSAVPSDFTDNHLDTLKGLAAIVDDPELRARLADVVWIRKRDYQMACLAIESYLQSGKRLEDFQHGRPCEDRIRRAISLSASLGKRAGYLEQVVVYIEDLLRRLGGATPSFLQAGLMDILLEYQAGDASNYAVLAHSLATHAEDGEGWVAARRYLDIETRWRREAKDLEGEKTALLRLAETYVKEANETLRQPQPSYMVASRDIQSAIEALRRVKGTKKRRDKLHGVLLEYQERSLAEMKAISQEMDLTKFVEQATEAVKGKTLQEAILKLVISCSPPKVKDLREFAKRLITDHPIQFFIPRDIVDGRGKVIARRTSIGSNNPSDTEAAIIEEMFGQAILHREVETRAAIEPMRRQISLEHRIRVSDLLPLVTDSPLVPEGREMTYARGLESGFEGDFLVAAHVLIPQLENSMRHLLNRINIPTCGLNPEGIQQEFNLYTTLRIPELTQVLDEDTVFDLKGLLVESCSANLRNRMAHGLLEHYEFSSMQVEYLWWLVLRLCCFFIYTKGEGDNDPKKE